jgi:hypothetical protein
MQDDLDGPITVFLFREEGLNIDSVLAKPKRCSSAQYGQNVNIRSIGKMVAFRSAKVCSP